MDHHSTSICSLPEDILQPLLNASNSSTLGKALEMLIKASKASNGQSDLASKNIVPMVLQLCQCLSYPCSSHLLLLSLELLKNLCAGEIKNQNLFVQFDGVETVFTILNTVGSTSDYEMIRLGLEVLANISKAGVEHQLSIWYKFFPNGFVEYGSMQRTEIFPPLCDILYHCLEGSRRLIGELVGDQGLLVMAAIIRTAIPVGFHFKKGWLESLFSIICFEENQFPQLFSGLYSFGTSENGHDFNSRDYVVFVSEQAFLLNILSEILHGNIGKISVPCDFALCVLGKLKQVVGVIDFVAPLGDPAGDPGIAVDILKFSLTILRDLCANDYCAGGGSGSGEEDDGSVDVGESLLSAGLLDLLLYLLGDLEPPAIIRKSVKKSADRSNNSSESSCLPYKGYRSDIVAVIANCTYGRKHVQDGIRQRNAILLLLQQCVTDEDNPFLREWGIWAVRNLLERNAENQRMVAELELQASVDVPELVALGLRVVMDPKTRRPKLVNDS